MYPEKIFNQGYDHKRASFNVYFSSFKLCSYSKHQLEMSPICICFSNQKFCLTSKVVKVVQLYQGSLLNCLHFTGEAVGSVLPPEGANCDVIGLQLSNFRLLLCLQGRSGSGRYQQFSHIHAFHVCGRERHVHGSKQSAVACLGERGQHSLGSSTTIKTCLMAIWSLYGLLIIFKDP